LPESETTDVSALDKRNGIAMWKATLAKAPRVYYQSPLSAASELTAPVSTSSVDRKKAHTFIQHIETSWQVTLT